MRYAVGCVSVLILLAGAPLAEGIDERKTILEVVDRAFEAVAARDAAIWREVLLEDGISLSFRTGADGAPEMRLIRNGDFMVTTRPDGKTYKESFTGEPTVLIRGSIAVVWGEYDFWIDGKFSHCGVDNIALANLLEGKENL